MQPTDENYAGLRKFTCRFDIPVENDKDFQVARRIIGQKGANMKKIVATSDAKLRLRGKGSGYLEGFYKTESPEPLHLCVSCTTKEGQVADVTASGGYTPETFRLKLSLSTKIAGIPLAGTATTTARRLGDVCPDDAARSEEARKVLRGGNTPPQS
jgi:hypothetical protein